MDQCHKKDYKKGTVENSHVAFSGIKEGVTIKKEKKKKAHKTESFG